MLAAVLRLCGQAEGSPSGVMDQSCARTLAPISPPPLRNSVPRVADLPCIVPENLKALLEADGLTMDHVVSTSVLIAGLFLTP
jgi:hypothetical protein